MRTQLSVYEKSFWDKQAALLTAMFPRLSEIVGMQFIVENLPLYLEKYPCDKNNNPELGRYYPKFLRQLEPIKKAPYLAELARFEWTYLMSKNKTQLISSLYPLHLKLHNKLKVKAGSLYNYALQPNQNKIIVHILTDFEYRLLHWFEPEVEITSILKRAALLGYSENQVYTVMSSLKKRNLIESKFRYLELA